MRRRSASTARPTAARRSRSSRTSPTRRSPTRRLPPAASTSSPAGSRSCSSTRNDPDQLYAAVFGYGLWRADQSGTDPTWEQVFHTMNQNDFTDPDEFIGDSTGDETEFDFVDIGGSDRDLRRRRVRRLGDRRRSTRRRRRAPGATTTPPRSSATRTGTCRASDPMGDTFNTAQRLDGELSSDEPGRPGLRASTTTARTASAATTASSPTRRAPGRARSGTWAR